MKNMENYNVRGKKLIRMIQAGKIRNITEDDKRFYLDFTVVTNESGTRNLMGAFSVGCNLNCYFCSSFTRNFLCKNPMQYIPPSAYRDIERTAGYYSPGEAFRMMMKLRESRYISGFGKYETPGYDTDRKINHLTIRGCEPTMGIRHIYGLLHELQGTGFTFVLDTNGLILGSSEEHLKKLSKYAGNLSITLSIKAGTRESFKHMTGVEGKLMDNQYKCLKYLVNSGIPYHVVYMCGENFNNTDEEKIILEKLTAAGFDIESSLLSKQDYTDYFVPNYKQNRKWSNKP